MAACGLDFGTSNSAIGFLKQGGPVLAPVEGAAGLIPSAVFVPETAEERVLFGEAAIAAYVGEEEGRLLRSLKSILGSTLIDESTQVGRRRVPLKRVIELFIRHLKAKAEASLGAELTHVVHGRPVHFVDGDAAADARAQDTLESIARAAGFKEVIFVYEPIAAACHYEAGVDREEVVLVADIGGGTSDFSVIRIGPGRMKRIDRADDVLANAGVRIGGTDFDTAFSLAAVMPLLGLGTHLVTKNLPVPMTLYLQLASWAFINFAYTARNVREWRAMKADAQAPECLARLIAVLQKRLGHRIALEVEAGKIRLSGMDQTRLALEFVAPGLGADATRDMFESAIAERTRRLHLTAAEVIAAAGLNAADIQTVFFTGGSSRVPAVRRAISSAAPVAKIVSGEDMASVALGLAREAANRFA